MAVIKVGSDGSMDTSRPAGEALTLGEVVALHTDGEWYAANAIVGANLQVPGFGIVDQDTAEDAYANVHTEGEFDGFTGLTIGQEVWLAETDGTVTSTAPTTSGDFVQRIGVAISATSIRLNVGTAVIVV